MKKCVAVFICLLLSCALGVNTFAEVWSDWDDVIGGVVFVGDSYCNGTNAKNDAKRHPEDAWAQITVDALGLTDYAISCMGGTGLAREKDGATFTDLLDDSLKQISNPETVGWIIVMGGYNDYPKSYDEIIKGGTAFVEHARELYPNAKIDFAMIGYDSKRPERQELLEKTVAPAWRKVAEQTGETYDGAPEIILKQTPNSMSNDGLHPNIEGQHALEQLPELFLNQRYRDKKTEIQEREKNKRIENKSLQYHATSNIMPIIVVGSTLFIAACIVVRIKIAEYKSRKLKHKNPEQEALRERSKNVGYIE